MSGGVLALDLATSVGWALGRVPARPLTYIEAATIKPPQPRSGTFVIARPGTPVGRFLARYRRWLEGMLVTQAPDALMLERPILPKKTNPSTAMKLNSLVGIALMLAHEHGIRDDFVLHAQPSTVKLHISGDGGPGKENVKNAISARGWVYGSDDEADALALWDYAAHEFARKRAAA